jgi:hypothetical protein
LGEIFGQLSIANEETFGLGGAWSWIEEELIKNYQSERQVKNPL